MFQKNKVSEAPACTEISSMGQRSWWQHKHHSEMCESQSRRKPTLSHLSRQLPNTEGTRPLPGAPRPSKIALPNHKHMQKSMRLDDSCCCCSMKIHQPPRTDTHILQMICHTGIKNISKLQPFVYTAQKRWGQHMMTNVANSVLIPHAGGEKPHQRVFMALLQGSSINLLIQYFWPGSGKANPDAASLNLK